MTNRLSFKLAIPAIFFLVVGIALLLAASATPVLADDSECVTCHMDETPGIVNQWQSGAMGSSGMDCSACHGSAHMDETDVTEALIPTPDTCAPCHSEQVAQYRDGKHALAWAAMEAMPAWSHLPTGIQDIEGYKGCSGCHKIGERSDEVIAAEGLDYGTASCDSCHTRHSFSKEEALQPEACYTCHQGFDHPQYEMWSSSKHGVIYNIEDGSDRAPTCQDCHLIDGTHTNITPWGFLGLRLPEEDEEWLADRVVILQALGVLDDNGDPTARLDIVSGAKVARLDADEFNMLRADIEAVCQECHSEDYVAAQMAASDQILKEADDIMAEAILIVKGLYEDGFLELPEGYDFGPDLLQFFSTGSSIEQELFTMFLEYRNRTFMGAFHNNPDYMWWYGYAAMQNSMLTIQDEAENMREGGTVGPQGPEGPQGPAGPEGPAGADGADAEGSSLTLLWISLAIGSIALIMILYILMQRRNGNTVN